MYSLPFKATVTETSSCSALTIAKAWTLSMAALKLSRASFFKIRLIALFCQSHFHPFRNKEKSNENINLKILF